MQTDNVGEFCEKPEGHPYEIVLALDGVDHGTTKVHSPQTNGFVERMRRTLLDECLSEHWFADIAHARRLIEAWRRDYNEVRPHSALENLPPGEFVGEA